MFGIIEFGDPKFWALIWLLLTLGIVLMELNGVINRRVRTITGMFWIFIGYTPETRWVFTWWKFGVFVAWVIGVVVGTSHFFLGIP